MSRKTSTTVYLDEEQIEQLAAMSKEKQTPVAALIRNGIDLILSKSPEEGGETGRLLEEFKEVKNELKAYKNLVHALLERIEKLESQLPTK